MDEEQIAQLPRSKLGQDHLWKPEHNYRYNDEIVFGRDTIDRVELNEALRHLNWLWGLNNDETVSLWKRQSEERKYRKALRKVEKTLDLSFVPREGLNLEDWEPETACCTSQWES